MQADLTNLMMAVKAVKAIPLPLIQHWTIEWASNVWTRHWHFGRSYYRNSKTQQSQWEEPCGRNEWGAYYYVHIPSGATQWQPPDMLFQYYPRAPQMLMYDPSNPAQ